DDRGLKAGLSEEGRPALHQLPLGGDEQHVHLQPFGVGIEDLEVELDVGHVERNVLLRLPADHPRASPSFIRSIWIFLTITSRPPTAVTTDRCFTPAVENRPRMASATIPGSMTSPSTMASVATSVVATFTSSASLPEWSMTTSLMMPEPMSKPTEVFLPPRNPKRAISA